MPKEKVIYDQAMMILSVEAEQAGIKGMSYSEFRKRREEQELQSVEQFDALRKELKEIEKIHS